MGNYLIQPNQTDWQLPGEEWRPVLGYEGSYEVSNFLRVRSLDRDVPRSNGTVQRRKGKILSIVMNDGYPQVALGIDIRRKIHVLVCEAWHGPKPTPSHEVAHGDNDRANCRPGNLRWATRKENMDDQIRHNGRHGAAQLYEYQVAEIKRLRCAGVKVREIAVQFGISNGLVSMICNGQRWGHLK